MRPEGELRVGLRLQPGRIERISVRSTRPDVARTLLIGRTVAEVQTAVPVLFSICGRSQATASRLACAAAAGLSTAGSALADARAAVAAETLREIAWQALLNASRWLGEEPAPDAVSAARAAMAYRWGQDENGAALAIARATFGRPAAEWLQLQTWPDVQIWADDGDTATARYIQSLMHTSLDASHAADTATATATPLLPPPTVDGLTALAAAIDADAGFAQQPTWRGAAAETGALARLQDDPLLDPTGVAAGACLPDRSVLRFVARLRELARLLSGPADAPAPVDLGSLSLGAGHGLAWVDSARGLLIHQVRLTQDRVSGYAIVAPTEWNFHPRGALAVALEGARTDDEASALALATRVVRALDPCVPCRVELDHA